MKKLLAVLLTLLMTCLLAVIPVAAETVEPVVLNVAYMPNYASLWLAVTGIHQGYFSQQGLELRLVEFADGPTIIAAMENGSIDIGFIGPGAHKLCINGRASIFALSHISNGDMLIGGKDITTVEQLKGKRVAYSSGTSSEDILVNSLLKYGMTMDDIQAFDMDASAGEHRSHNGGGVDETMLEHLRDILRSDEVNIEHNGLQNINRRIWLGYGGDSGLTIDSTEGEGFTVKLKLRLGGM